MVGKIAAGGKFEGMEKCNMKDEKGNVRKLHYKQGKTPLKNLFSPWG